jgi:surface antigen
MDSASQPQYGHVGIVTAINGDKISILQSNKAGEEQVFVSTKNKGDVLGYFDPTKSIDDFNKEVSGAVYQAQGLNKQ